MSTTVKVNANTFAVPARGDTDWDVNLRTYLQGITAAVAGVFQWGVNTFASSAVYYGLPGFAAASPTEYPMPIPASGILRNLRLYSPTFTQNGTMTATVRVNGANTALTCTFGTGASAAADATHAVTVNAGDRLSIKLDCTGMVATPTSLFATLSLSAL